MDNTQLTPDNIINSVTAVATVFALFFSIYAIYVSRKYSRKQILIGKYEEAFEIISLLNVDYEILYGLYQCRDEFESQNGIIERNISQLNYDSDLDKIEKEISIDEHFNKCIRLRVLGDAYFRDKLLLEITGFCHLYEVMINYSTNPDYTLRDNLFTNGFPTPDFVESFTMRIGTKIVEKINLGGKTTYEEKYQEYLQNDFKEELGIN